jgi:hypothetical protein
VALRSPGSGASAGSSFFIFWALKKKRRVLIIRPGIFTFVLGAARKVGSHFS